MKARMNVYFDASAVAKVEDLCRIVRSLQSRLIIEAAVASFSVARCGRSP